jgi:hypothetical protein
MKKYNYDGLTVSEADKQIIELSKTTGFQFTTNFQATHFVAGSQITPWRMVRQALSELDTRHQAYHDVSISLRKSAVKMQKFKYDLEHASTEVEREIQQINIDDAQYDIQVWERKLEHAKFEIDLYLEIINRYVTDEKPIEYYIEENIEEEESYWIMRMAKQASMDMIASGRIGVGNMDSIAMMPEEVQVKTLATTLQYVKRLNGGMKKIDSAVKKGLLANDKLLPEYDVPSITDTLLVGFDNDEKENIQLTSKPKVEGVPIN